MMRSQRVALGLVCLLGFQLFAATASAQNLRTGIPDGNIEVRLENVVQRVLDPATEFAFIDMAPFPDGTGRMAVSTIQGTIRVMDAGGNLLPDPLMTSAQLAQFLEPRTPPNEAGMTGIAFHPDFNNAGTFGYGKLYTITSDRRSNLAGGVPLNQIDYSFTGHSYQMLLREWNLATFGNVPGNAANNAFTGATSDSRELLRIAQPGKYHTLFDLAFNTSVGPTDPDYGNLYFTYGDGGDEAGIRTNADRANAAQGLSTIYGKIHRIDPDPAANPLVRTSANTGQPAYSIPADNPYNGDDATESRTAPTLAEIWANGVRSPWRLTFDRGTGDLYLGDVGENQREEVNRIERGKNYGWGQMEGTLDGTLLPGDGRLLPGLEPPLIEMPRGTGSNSVSGGFVYRGSAIPDLVGKYVFADLGQGYDYSAIFYAIVDPNDPDGEVGDVFEFKISPLSPKYEGTQLLPERIFSLGEDLNGEIYLVAGPDPRNPFVRSRPSLIIRLGAIPEPSTALLVIGGMTVVVLGSRRGFVRSSALQ